MGQSCSQQGLRRQETIHSEECCSQQGLRRQDMIYPEESVRRAIASLQRIDEELIRLVREGAIKLLSVKWLMSKPDSFRMKRRQELEALELEGEQVFLPAEDAAEALRRGKRDIGAMSYGWLSEWDPDPHGQRWLALRGVLRSGAVEIIGLFWDFPCLPQKTSTVKRTDAEQTMFDKALASMGNMYASACGTCVIQVLEVPCMPVGFIDVYNDRPYLQRGWCIFEDAVATEVVSRIAYFPELAKVVNEWTQNPKVVIVHGSAISSCLVQKATGSLKSRLDSTLHRITEAKFTGGKEIQDKVVGHYWDFFYSVGNAVESSAAALGVAEGNYEGDKNDLEEPHGHGKMIWPHGDAYEGQWEHGKCQGQGRRTYVDGSVYEGHWADGRANGQGRYTYADGSSHEGQWVDDKRHGQGRCTYYDGSIYDGELVDDKIHGQGRCTYGVRDIYDGQWVDEVYHGQGRRTYGDGSIYDGQWADGRAHGEGFFSWGDGSQYNGQWANDKRHGHGEYDYEEDGMRYVGQWADDRKHGHGRMIYANGKFEKEVEWCYDAQVHSSGFRTFAH